MTLMKQLIIATKNEGKAKDFQLLFAKKGYAVRTLNDFPHIPEIIEDGATFAENAIIKAEAVAQALGEIVIADDSGLAVDALDGKPGVYSARYAGEQKDDAANIRKVLDELQGVAAENRTAHFHCALAVAIPGKETIVVEGKCYGIITEQPIGDNGFGYDPIFYIKEKGKTMAELTNEEKNMISHRKKALELLEAKWESMMK